MALPITIDLVRLCYAIATENWPDWKIAKAELADYLEEAGDERAALVQAIVPVLGQTGPVASDAIEVPEGGEEKVRSLWGDEVFRWPINIHARANVLGALHEVPVEKLFLVSVRPQPATAQPPSQQIYRGDPMLAYRICLGRFLCPPLRSRALDSQWRPEAGPGWYTKRLVKIDYTDRGKAMAIADRLRQARYPLAVLVR